MRCRDASRRLRFIALFLVALVGMPTVPKAAPPNHPRIGFLSLTTRSPNQVGLTEALAAHGYVEGKTITIDSRYAEGSDQRLNQLAADLVASKPDVIATVAPPAALALKNATRTIPIVFLSVSDPVALGLAKSLAQPGGNVTGIANMPADLNKKRLQIIKEMIPGLRGVALIARAGNANSQLHLASELLTARQLNLDARVYSVVGPGNFDEAFRDIVRDKMEAVAAVQDNVLFANREKLMALAVANRLPAIADGHEYARAGALVAYGADTRVLYRRAGEYVVKILNGADPATLPVEQPFELKLVINMKIARRLQITVPAHLIARADELIE